MEETMLIARIESACSTLLVTWVGILASSSMAFAQALPWMNPALAPAERAALLVAAMTLDQKIEQLHGQPGPIPEVPSCGNGGRHVPGIPELQIPTFRITNGPVGIGAGDCSPQAQATALPSSLALSASWDPALAYAYGDLIGREAVNVGVHVVEGPGMNMLRVPQGGRNFEYLGEDPFLAGALAVQEIHAVQSHNIIAMAKHFVANEQEANRGTVNEIIDARTLSEIYLLPFEMSVKDGDVAAVMCAYPRVNGTYNCENNLMRDTLRGLWGYQGYVQSDFGATHSTAASILAGLDHEMSTGVFFTPANIAAALSAGTIYEANINTMLLRRYTQMFRFGQFDRPITLTQIDAVGNGQIARSIADQSAVLLKNANSVLPLNASALHSIALIGRQNLTAVAVTGGGGSSKVAPLYTVAPLQGLQSALGAAGSGATVTYNDGTNAASAAALAAASDVAIVMVGDIESEGTDRTTLSLPNNGGVIQDALVAAVAAANPKTVVVIKNGDPVLMPWIDQVPAVLVVWYPGQEDGNVVADLLFGVANPSGKLPATFPVAAADVPAHTPQQYPGVLVNGIPTATYSEGLEMGYRWYDAQGIKPLFPFGFGLSYTSFALSKIEATPEVSDGTHPILVQFFVENTGSRSGAEVPQVYLGLPASTGEPPKRLVAFDKVRLAAGDKTKVQLTIDPAASNHPLSYWDVDHGDWSIADGDYAIYVGNSSADIALTGRVHVSRPPRGNP
jgi:beta-glucosidase